MPSQNNIDNSHLQQEVTRIIEKDREKVEGFVLEEGKGIEKEVQGKQNENLPHKLNTYNPFKSGTD